MHLVLSGYKLHIMMKAQKQMAGNLFREHEQLTR